MDLAARENLRLLELSPGSMQEGTSMSLEYLALGMMIFVGIVFFYGIIAIHDIPYEIAKKRGHPHLEAIHYAGWISMFTLHSIWPFLWIWATIYHADRGYGFSETSGQTQEILRKLEVVEQRMETLESRLTKPAPDEIAPDTTPVQSEPEEA